MGIVDDFNEGYIFGVICHYCIAFLYESTFNKFPGSFN